MPITRKVEASFYDSTGQRHASIEEAQLAELQHLLSDFASVTDPHVHREIALFIQRQSDTLLAILTTGPRSRPATRKRAGTTNPRRATRHTISKEKTDKLFAQMREAVENGEAATQLPDGSD